MVNGIMSIQSADSRVWTLCRSKSQGFSADKLSGKVRDGGGKLGIRRDLRDMPNIENGHN